ncbi:SpaH/EbpB family LPXTG-anchored major pilin [Enterococcus sp. N342-3-1-2]
MKKLLVNLLLFIPILLWGQLSLVHAAEQPETQKITLHKLVFDTIPKEQQNTGDIMSWEKSQPLKNAGFTAYDVTIDYWKVYNETSGSQPVKQRAAETTVKGLQSTSLKAYVFDLTDGSGLTTMNLPVVSNDQNAVYLFKETTTPNGAIAEKSVDFVVGLPVINSDGANKENVHLYPKNQYETSTIQLTKYGVSIDEKGEIQAPEVLHGAAFILKERDGNYFSSETNTFDAKKEDATAFISDVNGLVQVEDLILKDNAVYEFIEIDSEVATEANQGIAQEIYHFKTNPAVVVHTVRDKETSSLKITYDYYDENQKLILGSDVAEAYNYKVPEPVKTVDDADVDIDQVFTYTIKQQIPKDIARYSIFQLVDTPDSSLVLVSTATEIADSLTINDEIVSSNLVDIKTEGVLTFTFTPTELIAYQGQTISLTVKMKLKPGTDMGKEIGNKIELNNDFHLKTDEVSVKTYGKTFKKVNADTQNPLAGAEFNVKKNDQYLVLKDGKVSWSNDQNQAHTFISGEDGAITLSGIAQKDENDQVIMYQLVEKKAPDGYVLPKSAWDFQADNGVESMLLTNKLEGSLPLTGGMGITVFVITGILIIGTAVLYFSKRKHA